MGNPKQPASFQSSGFMRLSLPFPTVQDDVDLADIQDAWFGKPVSIFGGKPLMMEEVHPLSA